MADSFPIGLDTFGDITMSGKASVRDHVAATEAVIAILGSSAKRPVFTMKDTSRVTHNTMTTGIGAAVVRGCSQLPTFIGVKPRVTGNTPKNVVTVQSPC